MSGQETRGGEGGGGKESKKEEEEEQRKHEKAQARGRGRINCRVRKATEARGKGHRRLASAERGGEPSRDDDEGQVARHRGAKVMWERAEGRH